MKKLWPILTLIILFASTMTPNNCQAQKSGKSKPIKKPICITFDELPVATSFVEVDARLINDSILAVLKRHKVKSAGFVVGSKIGDNFDILGQWLNEGHRIGNLTFSYHDYSELEIDAFLQDIVRGSEELEPMLSGFGQKPRFFRYPFLHYGDTPSKKAGAIDFLDEFNIKVAHATILVEDYLYNLTVEKSRGKLDDETRDQILNEYINHVLDEVERSEETARYMLKRSARQILQLKANSLNALFLDDLLTALEDHGYIFISLDQALKDKIYSKPEAYFGLRGISYLDMLRLSDSDYLPAE